MSIFDLLFIVLFLTSLVTLLTAAVTALRGRGARAVAILRRFGVSFLAYVLVVAVVGLFSSQRVIPVGDPWCFDDWCLSVENVSRMDVPPLVAWHVSLRVFSEARRVSQRAKGAWIYVIDSQGNRYAPDPDPSAVPLDVLLGPGESVTTSRVFRVPAGAAGLGLITGHGGAGLITKFIIGDPSSLFHKPTFIRLTP